MVYRVEDFQNWMCLSGFSASGRCVMEDQLDKSMDNSEERKKWHRLADPFDSP